MIIYVFTGDYRSFGNSPDLWGGETIPVEVADNFQGGAKTYKPDTGEWIDDPELPVDFVINNKSVRDQLRAFADYAIVPLQYAVDLGEATEDEQTLLTKWKQYCVRLNRIDITLSEPGWPPLPD